MFKIRFFKDAKGNESVAEYIETLENNARTNKDARIKYQKITAYLNSLALHGTKMGEPYTKHIEGDIWELRPLQDRIFYFCWRGDSFIILHHFIKKTQKTPKREIEQAKRNMLAFIEREG